MAVLTVIGFQVPSMPLVLVPIKAGGVAPSHNGSMASKVGVIGAFTVTCRVAVFAHSPGAGVKV